MRVIGARKLEAKLRRLPNEIHKDVAKMVKKSGEELATVARALAPEVTGELKNTIDVEYEDRGMTAVISAGGNDPDEIIKAKTIEGGRNPASKAGGMEAQPYMNRAASHLAKKIRGRLKRAVSKAAKRVSNG